MNVCDIADVSAEAGIIATIVLHPEYVYYSEKLTPHHFTNEQNGYMYYAISELAKKGVSQIDAYNITNILNARPETKVKAESLLPVSAIKDFIIVAPNIARHSIEEYRLVVDSVMSAALRRNLYMRLLDAEKLCFQDSESDIEQQVYEILDDVMSEYASTNDIPEYKDIIDSVWKEIEARQGNGCAGLKFKFPTLNNYVTIDRGELVIFAAEAKQGKSMMLLNIAVDLMKQNQAVLYLDSELNDRMFTARIIAHLSGIEFRRLTSGEYSQEEAEHIEEAKAWLKTRKLTHLYIPMFDIQTIYTAIKRVHHTQGLDVLIVDYFKSSDEPDAYSNYAELGKFVDLIKNRVAGDMDIAALGAVQATSSGKVADSAKIGRNASCILLLQEKTPEEIEMDGEACGNKKLRVLFNRNGAQMAPGEYIDLYFDGNHILYEEATQHDIQVPW